MSKNKLTAGKVEALIRAGTQGRHSDGGGLYLAINGGSAAWVFRYIIDGRERQMGLGPARNVPLAIARNKAQGHRATLAQHEDPQGGDESAVRTVTFREAAGEFLKKYRAGLKNEKHREQVDTRLATYAYPELGGLPVNRIKVAHIKKALEPVWNEKPETASRVRGLIEKTLDYAKVMGWRSGENPAAWKGNLEHVFTRVSQLREVRHHPALDYRELPEFMAELREQTGVGARALEFLILTNARTADIIGVADRPDKPPLRWSDIDFKQCVWEIPRSKASAMAHRKPLPPRAMEILAQMRSYRLDDTIVFPSLDRPGQSLSSSGLRGVIREAMARGDLSVHGFRATFKTWAGEETATPFEVVEASMAHGIIKDKVEAAYRRKDFFAKRRVLMDAWADYAGSGEKTGGKVIRMR